MKKIIIALLCLLSFSALAQNSTAEQDVLGTMTTAYPYWNPVTSSNPLPAAVYDSSNSPGDCLISNGSASAATFQACGGGGGGSLAIQATTTSTKLFPLMALTTGSSVTTTYIDVASPWNYTPSTGLTGILGITTTAFTDNGVAALNGTTTVSGALNVTATAAFTGGLTSISTASIAGGNAIFTTTTSTNFEGTSMALAGTATIGTAQILAGNALLTTITATNVEYTNALGTTITGTTGHFPTLTFTTGTGTNIALSGTITATGLSSGTVAANSYMGVNAAGLVVLGSGGTTSPAGSSGNIQYNGGSGFAANSGLNVSTTRGGIDFLANVTTANLISLGNNGADVTSYALGESALLAQSTTNLDNTAIGGFALSALTTGSNNTALGWDAGQSLTTDGYNTAIGARALLTQAAAGTTSATGNVAVGYNVLSALTTGTNNIAIGNLALKATLTSGKNIAIGDAALSSSSSGPNIAIGDNTGAGMTTGFNNIMIGNGIDSGASIANANVYIGMSVLNGAGNNDSDNVYIGYSSGCTAGYSNNVMIGEGASCNTSGSVVGIGGGVVARSNDVVIGKSASGADGGDNVVIGNGAGNDTSPYTGAHNTIIGYQVASSSITSAQYNILVGADSTTKNVLGTTTSSTCIGVGSVCGSADVAYGYKSLDATATNNNDNTAIGYQALTAVTTGINNTGLGYKAGALITTGTGNIAIGNNAGGVLTVGSGNIYIGNSLNATTTADSNTINIGGIYLATATGTATTSVPVIHGTVSMPDLAQSSAAQTGTVCWSSGAITYDGSLGCLTSTKENKEKIVSFSGGLAEVLKFKPVSFYYKDKKMDASEELGLLAEDVKDVEPRLVGYGSDGKLRGVRYEQLTAVLISAIQDQQKEIDDLKKQLAKKK